MSDFVHISKVVEVSLDEIERRKKGEKFGLTTRWNKLNSQVGGGIQKSMQYIIAGRPGSGKSAFANLLIFDLFDLNPDTKLKVLYFNFEMPSYRQLFRVFSKGTGLSVNKLLSVDEAISDSHFSRIKELKNKVSKYPIFFFDVPLSIKQIGQKTLEFQEKNPDDHLVLIFDHSRLIKRDNESNEMTRLSNFSKQCMYLKKMISCTTIILSQLNRNIEQPNRASSKYKPMLSDIFGADSIAQDADTIFMIHRPELYDVKNYLGFNAKNLIALHIEKNRDGAIGMVPMQHELSINKIEEIWL